MRILIFFLSLGLAHAAPADELDREAAKHESEPDPAARMAEDLRDAQDKMRDDVGESLRRKAEDAERLSSRMQAQYDLLLKNLAAQRERQRRLVLRQWEDFRESTTKEWVDYSDRGDAVSKVDFEKGRVEVEVLVPVEEVTKKTTPRAADLDAGERAKLQKLAEDKLAAQLKKALSEKDTKTTEVLKDQIKALGGETLTPDNAPRLVKRLETSVEDKPVVAQDGKPRLKVAVKIDLVPDHMRIRAKRHEAQVTSVARRYGLDPALVYAVIQTESEFNPRARSQAPAFGLMQLMPKSGAREAYQYLYKEERVVSPDYLYDPDNNILLGATYLHMLRTRHFPKVKDPENQRTLMIAAYNCGPGCVRKNILSKHDVDAMTNAELLLLIRRAAPKETQEYVPRVQGRIASYRKL